MFFRKKPISTLPKPLYGVNLGGWLVLEKWMTPSLFEGFDAADEYTLCRQMGVEMLPRLTRHRDTFITLTDFEWLRAQGIEAVRLPVGYWAFGDVEPYAPTIHYVDKAFEWAKQTGMRILLDMHAAPGSQNGNDHSGKVGEVGWDDSEANAIQTLEVLTRLVRRYKDHPSLLGVELLNEPSVSISKRTLMKYYRPAYRMIRWECGEETWVVFCDSGISRPRRWRRKLRGRLYKEVYFDMHRYQIWGLMDKRQSASTHIRKTLGKVARTIRRMQRRHPVIVGEWSIALDPGSFKGLNAAQTEAAYRAYGAAQLVAYGQTSAWFYWSYKTEEGGAWSYRDCIETGRLPQY